MIQEILAFVRELISVLPARDNDDYGQGYEDALLQVQEYIEDTMWREGVDDGEET